MNVTRPTLRSPLKKSQCSYESICNERVDNLKRAYSNSLTNQAFALTALDELRYWVFRNVKRSAGTSHIPTNEVDVFKLGVVQSLVSLRETGSGFWCAGYANLLCQLYTELGYEAISIAFGLPGLYTHALTLVKYNNIYYLQDPYINHRVSIKTDENACYSNVIHAIRLGHDLSFISNKSKSLQCLLFPKNSTPPGKLFYAKHSWLNGNIQLREVHIEDIFLNPLWLPTEKCLQRSNPQTNKSGLALFFQEVLWIADPKLGFYSPPKQHPWYKELFA